MPAPEAIQQLVETFASHIEHYKSSGYNETELRREFLDPFWKALGWDIDNTQGYADAYKDVIHEDAIKIGGYTKAPDYCFRIGGTRKFFLEAKKPSVAIKSDEKPAYQLRRYAWSAKLPLSVLSDFEELAIYDTRIRPNQSDKPSKARTFFCTYEEYAEKWDEIAAIFSREAVLKGSFDNYADTSKKKRGTAEVDDAFLEEIERWRDLLAKNFALRNPQLSVRDLNYAVQKTIDRLIFLRICEDRGTEDYGRLMKLQNGTNIWGRLNEQFRRADDRYNSGLFHFKAEKGRDDAPDRLTPQLALDDKVLKDIIKHLYYPDSPYEFSVLPADILGQVYEQFLGKTIRLTDSHQAKIEEKPEVRKAGGVYYTPTYIVDYIVENTLGRLLNGDDPTAPKPIPVSQAAKLKVCDPACGSGSFLIVAYQYLLDWHRDQYTLDPDSGEPDEGKIKRHSAGKNPKIYQAKGGGWKLTTPERKRILLNNIYGVDIDSQAVEVTKLSLLLKVLEGETQQQLQRDFISERQRILPDLGNNIQCGNSLIGPDFYDNEQMQLLDEETKYRVNVFDWERAFAEVFKDGGFDCVIGNPPYIRIQSMKDTAPEEACYYQENYRSAGTGNFDIYVCFLEKFYGHLATNGEFGMIVPNKFMTAKYGEPLRNFIICNGSLSKLVDFGSSQVFKGATTYCCLLFQTKRAQPKAPVAYIRAKEPTEITGEGLTVKFVDTPSDPSTEWQFEFEEIVRLRDRLLISGVRLGEVFSDIFQGLITGCDSVFILQLNENAELYSRSLETVVDIEHELLFPLCKGSRHLRRYHIEESTLQLLFPYRKNGNQVALLDEATLSKQYPKAWSYLLSCREVLIKREKGKWDRPDWYSFSRPQNLAKLPLPKIMTPAIALRPAFSIDKSGDVRFPGSGGGGGGGYGLICKSGINESPIYFLGLVNSLLFEKFVRACSSDFSGGYLAFNRQYIENLPIRPIDFDNPADVAQHDKMVSLVERMLDLQKQKAGEGNPNTLKQLETQIKATDRQIDRLVYELYELTDEEIALVEQGA